MSLVAIAAHVNHVNKRLGGHGHVVMTLEFDRPQAEAVCFELSQELKLLSLRTDPFVLSIGEIFTYHGVKFRIVEKA